MDIAKLLFSGHLYNVLDEDSRECNDDGNECTDSPNNVNGKDLARSVTWSPPTSLVQLGFTLVSLYTLLWLHWVFNN